MRDLIEIISIIIFSLGISFGGLRHVGEIIKKEALTKVHGGLSSSEDLASRLTSSKLVLTERNGRKILVLKKIKSSNK